MTPDPDRHEPGTRDFYVSVINGPRKGLLAGPFATHAEALALVDRARDEAERVDAWACHYAFGTASLPRAPTNPAGMLNARLGVAPRPPY